MPCIALPSTAYPIRQQKNITGGLRTGDLAGIHALNAGKDHPGQSHLISCIANQSVIILGKYP